MNGYFEIGDRVMIRPDLSRDVDNWPFGINSDMLQYAGKVATINDKWGGNHYAINLDDGCWQWSDDMFLPTGTRRDMQNANCGRIFGYPYSNVPREHLPAVKLIPNKALRSRIIHDMRKCGVSI